MSEIFYMSEIFAEKLQTIAENVPKVYNKGFEDGNKGKIQVWQSNTEYEVGDVVIANFEEDLELADILFHPEYFPSRTVIAKCISQHISQDDFDIYAGSIDSDDGTIQAWEILQETYAYYDALGRGIHHTYATKEEVGNTTVDQTYNPKSENAQSGIAVAEAVEPISTKINVLEKRVTNLEQGFVFFPFETDCTVAYQKIVPTNAFPYAEVEKVGGMTRKCANLIPLKEKTNTHLGITFTVNNDGTVTANGTATGTASWNVVSLPLKAGQSYCISSGVTSGSDKTYQMFMVSDNGAFATVYNIKNGTTFTPTADGTVTVWIYVYSGVTINNLTFYPMLNEGSAALPYEYFEGLRSAPVTEVESVGTNLIPFPYDEESKTQNGITWTVNADGSVTANGTATKDTEFYIIYHNKTISLPAGEYSFTCGGNSSSTYYSRVVVNNVTNINDEGKGCKITLNDGDNIYILLRIKSGVTASNLTFKPMINKGLTAAPYAPYREPISFPIPTEVQALDGYGWGVNDACYNYIDWKKKQFVKRVGKVDLGTLSWYETSFDDEGNFNAFVADVEDMALPITAEDRKTGFICEMYSPSESVDKDNLSDKSIIRHEDGAFYIRDNSYSGSLGFAVAMRGVMLYYELAEPIITDISNLITDDNFIEVEGNGMLTFKNEYEYAVPSEVTYQLKGVAE